MRRTYRRTKRRNREKICCNRCRAAHAYAKVENLWLKPAWLEGREVIAVFDRKEHPLPGYFMWLEWRNGRIVFIRDYRHDRYVMRDAELVMALQT